MAFQPVPGGIECVVSGRMADAQTWVNVFHLDQADYTFSQAMVDALAASLDTFYTGLAPFMQTDWHVDNVQAYEMDTQGSTAYNSVITVTGSGSGAPLPNQIALVVSWLTDKRGRNFRGRTYLGGWTEVASDGNGPTSGAVTAAVDWSGDMLGLGLQVVSRRLNNAPRAAGIMTPITAARTDAVWDTMRSRRLPGT